MERAISEISFSDIWDLFEGRRPPRPSLDPEPEKYPIGLDVRAATHTVRENIKKAAGEYDKITINDNDNIDFPSPHDGIRTVRTFYSERLSREPPRLFALTKAWRRPRLLSLADPFSPRSLPGSYSVLRFSLTGGDNDSPSSRQLTRLVESDPQIGDFIMLPNQSGDWNLVHREVVAEFRDQGIGSLLLCAAESFVDSYAKQKKIPQKITVNCSQPRVLLMFLKKGYLPKTEGDRERIDKVLSGDKDLILDFGSESVQEADGTLSEPSRDKELYCFERNVAQRTPDMAFRIVLEKTFFPEDPVESSRGEAGSAAKRILFS